jgi:hypothetical protein
MMTWVHTKIEESNELALAVLNSTDSIIPCPTCHRRLTRFECWQFVKESHSARLQELEKKAELQRNSAARGMLSVHESLRPLFAALACFCSVCWVVPIPILQAVALLPLAYLLCMSDLLKAEVTKMFNCKLCPKCRTPIIKNGGCAHMHCRCGHHFDWKRAPWYCFHSRTVVLAAFGVLVASVLTLLLAVDLLLFRTCLATCSTVKNCSSTFQSIRVAVFWLEQGFCVGCQVAPWVAAGLGSICDVAVYFGGVAFGLGKTLALGLLPIVAVGGWHFVVTVSCALRMAASAAMFIGGIAPDVGRMLVLRLLPAIAVGAWHSATRGIVQRAGGRPTQPRKFAACLFVGGIAIDVVGTLTLPAVMAGLHTLAVGALGLCAWSACTLAGSVNDFIVGAAVAHLRSVFSLL